MSLYEIDLGKCVWCNEEGNTLHHISYFPEIKMRVCKKCHRLIHWNIPELCAPPHDYYWWKQTENLYQEFNNSGFSNSDFSPILAEIHKKGGRRTDTIVYNVKKGNSHLKNIDELTIISFLYSLLRAGVIKRKKYKYDSNIRITPAQTNFLWYRNNKMVEKIISKTRENNKLYGRDVGGWL